MSSPDLFGRFRVPLGSLVVDIGLVLTLVFATGQMTERFVIMDQRLAKIESISAEAKIQSLELRMAQAERDRRELKDDIVKRLDRIESLLDRN